MKTDKENQIEKNNDGAGEGAKDNFDAENFSSQEKSLAKAFIDFYRVIKTLRAPGGCPWDREQTPLTMRTDLIEETFEAVDAISCQDAPHVQEELGDVFLNTTMIGYMHEQEQKFTLADVFADVTQKLIRRHPHVFKESEGSAVATGAKTAEQVLSQWDAIKEKIEHREENHLLDQVAKGLPPLTKGAKYQKKAAKKGFDWQNVDDVYDKLQEEIAELRDAQKNFAPHKDAPHTDLSKQKAFLHLEEELGDVLFSVVNLSRMLGVDPAIAMERANSKFYARFAYVEDAMRKAGQDLCKENFARMDAFWDEAKSKGL